MIAPIAGDGTVLRFFFCFNEVAYALGLQAARALPGRTLLIASRERVRKRSSATIGYHWTILGLILLASLLSRRVEVVLPHVKTSPALRWLARCARSIALVDDGMDTFRSQPRNVDVSSLGDRPIYYTFDHRVPVAKWLERVRPVRLMGIESLADVERPPLDLDGFDRLVIESPGVEMAVAAGVDSRKCFYLRHPNRDKNQPLMEGVASASGLDCSTERTLLGFRGDVVVGETMALVFALGCLGDRSRLHVRLTRASYENLGCLHDALATCGSLEVSQE